MGTIIKERRGGEKMRGVWEGKMGQDGRECEERGMGGGERKRIGNGMSGERARWDGR